MSEERTFDIGEFASFKLVEDQATKTFTITLRGDVRFADLLGHKVGSLQVTQAEIDEWVSPPKQPV